MSHRQRVTRVLAAAAFVLAIAVTSTVVRAQSITCPNGGGCVVPDGGTCVDDEYCVGMQVRSACADGVRCSF